MAQLLDQCAICKLQGNPVYSCHACKIITYCSEEHQEHDASDHEAVCSVIRKATDKASHISSRQLADDISAPMKLCEDYLLALSTLPTKSAVYAAMEHCLAIAKETGQEYELQVYQIIACLYLRYGDDERSHLTMIEIPKSIEDSMARESQDGGDDCSMGASDTESDDGITPFLINHSPQVRLPDLLRPLRIDIALSRDIPLAATVLLLKLRVLLDLTRMRLFKDNGIHIDAASRNTFLTSIVNRRDLRRKANLGAEAVRLRMQVNELFALINAVDRSFWSSFVERVESPKMVQLDGEDMILEIMNSNAVQAWRENPQAMKILRAKLSACK